MADPVKKWYLKLFGDNLIKCRGLGNDNLNAGDKKYASTQEIFENFYKIHEKEDVQLVIGVYFSSAEAIPDEFENQLIRLHGEINGGDFSPNSNVYDDNFKASKVAFEVIHVFLTSSVHWIDRLTVDEAKALDRLKEYPWYAIPFTDGHRMMRLTRKYQIKSLTPSLVLLNGRTGKVITKDGRDRLMEDPAGSNFPWKPRPLHEVLRNVQLHAGGKMAESFLSTTLFDGLEGFIVGFYFSAHWCPPCRGFTPQLVETYNLLKRTGANFEIIFVSSDRSLDSYKAYLESMPWFAVPYSEQECRRELASLFGVQGIPTLVLVDEGRSVITCDGRGEVNDDPTGRMFPWRPRSVNILTERQSAKLQDGPAVILFIEGGEEAEMEFAESVLSPAVKEFLEKNQNESDDYEEEVPLEFFIACDSETSDTLREFIGLEDFVPLLALVNVPEGTWAALEDGVDVTEETVKDFVERFFRHDLPMRSIYSHEKGDGNA